MMVLVTTGNSGDSLVTVEWTDSADMPCRIKGTRFGEYAIPEQTLRSLYDALDFLYGKHRAE